MLHLKKLLLFLLLLACSRDTQDVPAIPPGMPEDTPSTDYPAAQWTATYHTGDFAFESRYPEFRDDRTVGVFYFLWIGAHGSDVHEDHNSVQVPKTTDIITMRYAWFDSRG